MALPMSNNKVALLLVLWLFLIISSTESRQLATGKSKPSCNLAIPAEAGDTCASLSDAFAQELDFFLSINPNINCDDIFNLLINGFVSVGYHSIYAAAACWKTSSRLEVKSCNGQNKGSS